MTEMLDFSGTPAKVSLNAPTGIKHVVLLDANNLAARSYHAAKGRLTSMSSSGESVETGSLHLFMLSLSKYLREMQPTHFVACWDGGRSLHRELIYPEYKAARRAKHAEANQGGEPPHGPAYSLIGEFLDLCGIQQWYMDGVEADDLIAAGHRIVRKIAGDQKSLITIMSTDKDMLQLLDDNTHQLRFSSYGTPTDLWSRERVISDFGYTPEQIPVVMAFTGDTSDGVPGSRGIGPKKAVKLLEKHGWNFLAAAAEVPDTEMVMRSRALVDLLGEHDPADMFISSLDDPYFVPEYDPLHARSKFAQERLESLTHFCAQYRLKQLWESVVHGTLWW